MNIDWGHMAATMVVIFVVIIVGQKTGITTKGEGRFNWRLAALLFAAIFILNLVWPYSG